MESLTGERERESPPFLILDFRKLGEVCPVPAHILQSFQMCPQPCGGYCQTLWNLVLTPICVLWGDPYDDLSSMSFVPCL